MKSAGTKLLSTRLPKFEKDIEKTTEKSEPTNMLGNPNEKPSIVKLSMTKKDSDESKKQNFNNPLFDADISWQNKAVGDGNISKDAKEVPSFDSSFVAPAPKNSMVAELQKQESEKNNHQFNDVVGDYQHEVISNYYKDGELDSDEYKHALDYLNHKTTPPVAYYGRIDKNNDLENSEY